MTIIAPYFVKDLQIIGLFCLQGLQLKEFVSCYFLFFSFLPKCDVIESSAVLSYN